jgi:hypothetical protein
MHEVLSDVRENLLTKPPVILFVGAAAATGHVGGA